MGRWGELEARAGHWGGLRRHPRGSQQEERRVALEQMLWVGCLGAGECQGSSHVKGAWGPYGAASAELHPVRASGLGKRYCRQQEPSL